LALVTPAVNELADRLGYVRVDDGWGSAARPGDMRASAKGQAPDRASPALIAAEPLPPGSLLVSQRLQAGLRGVEEEFRRDWKPYSDEPFLIIALAAASSDDAWWLVDVTSRRAVTGSGNCTEEAAWLVSAPATAWEQVIRDGMNLGTAFRRSGMRYWDRGDAGAGSIIAEHRVAMMSKLLDITTWTPDKGSVPAAALP
jgi:hypothetical protein